MFNLNVLVYLNIPLFQQKIAYFEMGICLLKQTKQF